MLQLNGIDLPSQLKLIESYDVKSKPISMLGLHDLDMDGNLIHIVNSKYYDIIGFLGQRKSTSIFLIPC